MIDSSEKMSPQIDKDLCHGRVLLVEPDRLTRWSVHEYLKKDFDVTVVEYAEIALKQLASKIFDAIVVANDLPASGADRIEHFARDQNDQLLVVRTTTAPAGNKQCGQHTVYLEKPFELSALVRVLNSHTRTGKTAEE